MLKRCLHVFSPMATVVCSQSASSGQGFLFLSFTVVSARISAARLVFATLGDMLNPRGLANSRRCVFLKCASVFERGCRKIEVRYPAFSASASAADGLFSRQPYVLSLPPVAGRESFRSLQAAPTAGAITKKKEKERNASSYSLYCRIYSISMFAVRTALWHWRLCVWCPLRDYRCKRRALRGKPPRDLEEGKSFFLLLLLALLPPGTQVFSESEPSLFGGPLRPLPSAATRPSPFTLPCWRSLFALLPPFFLFVAPLACAYVLVFGVAPSPPNGVGRSGSFSKQARCVALRRRLEGSCPSSRSAWPVFAAGLLLSAPAFQPCVSLPHPLFSLHLSISLSLPSRFLSSSRRARAPTSCIGGARVCVSRCAWPSARAKAVRLPFCSLFLACHSTLRSLGLRHRWFAACSVAMRGAGEGELASLAEASQLTGAQLLSFFHSACTVFIRCMFFHVKDSALSHDSERKS